MPASALAAYKLVFDAVYTPLHTRLLREAQVRLHACCMLRVACSSRSGGGRWRVQWLPGFISWVRGADELGKHSSSHIIS